MSQNDRFMIYRGNRGYGKRSFALTRIRQISARIAYLEQMQRLGFKTSRAEVEYYEGERRALLQWLEASGK